LFVISPKQLGLFILILFIMEKYLFCYYTEINDECKDLEKIIEAVNFKEAVIEFDNTTVYKKITSASEIINFNFTPDFTN
jgi:hypothetical protein